MRGKGRIFHWRALILGVALSALFAFMIIHVAECPVAFGAGSHGAAHATAAQAHSESKGIGPAGHRCHHDAGHQHMGGADKLYASPRRVVDQVDAPVGPDAADWSAAGALVLLGVQRRGPPSSISPSSPSGRHILISTCVART